MTANNFEKIAQVFQPPIYTFREAEVGIICDKFEDPEKFEFKRKRYIITNENQCTCLGFMKFNDCKHLQMLRGNFDWIKRGVSGTILKDVVSDLIKHLKDTLPESASQWENIELGESITEVKGVELIIKDQTKKKANRIIGVKTFFNNSQLAVSFLFDKMM